jgi:DNA-binding transcriptional LysR family regulator
VAWIGGCERCRDKLITVCRQEAFTPRIASFSDEMVVVQALVAAGVGVVILPGLALRPTAYLTSTPPNSPTSPARSTPSPTASPDPRRACRF